MYVFDTGAISQFFAGNQQINEIINQVRRKTSEALIAEPILSEFFYKVCQKEGLDIARLRVTSLIHSEPRLFSIVSLTEELVMEAGKTKCQVRIISFADSITIAVAKLKKAHLVTTDGELRNIPDLKVRKIDF